MKAPLIHLAILKIHDGPNISKWNTILQCCSYGTINQVIPIRSALFIEAPFNHLGVSETFGPVRIQFSDRPGDMTA